MLKSILLIALFAVSMLMAGGGPIRQPLSEGEMVRYYQVLDDEVAKASQLAAHAAQKCSQASHDPGKFAVHLVKAQEITTMAMVKENLLQGMRNTPSMDSPIIRSALMDMLKQETITIEQLNQFEKILNEVKNQIKIEECKGEL